MKDIRFTVENNVQIADGIYEMVLSDNGEGHGVTSPGQFVNIKLDGFFLRRPISVCSWDESRITLIYKVVGNGTEKLSRVRAGEDLMLLTPLGNGFDISEAMKSGGRALIIGGGAGVPPMYGLCRALAESAGSREGGDRPIALLGFNTKAESFYIDEFKKTGAEVRVATLDGSVGEKGMVTDLIGEGGFTYVFCCGPEAMLRAVDKAVDDSVDGQYSFEERMGCGFGACMGCSCRTKYGSKRICREGPVLKRGEIIW